MICAAMAATEKAMAETEEAAQQLLGHADVRTTRENYIRRRKLKRATSVKWSFWRNESFWKNGLLKNVCNPLF
jgi:hypothetical protein